MPRANVWEDDSSNTVQASAVDVSSGFAARLDVTRGGDDPDDETTVVLWLTAKDCRELGAVLGRFARAAKEAKPKK